MSVTQPHARITAPATTRSPRERGPTSVTVSPVTRASTVRQVCGENYVVGYEISMVSKRGQRRTSHNKARFRYIADIFLRITHERHPIARP